MHNKELFLLQILFLHNAQNVQANIDNTTIYDFNFKRTKYEKGTNVMKTLLAEWIKSRSYKPLKSGNLISKSR